MVKIMLTLRGESGTREGEVMRMAFKRQIKLTAATEEAKWEATIPNPSDTEINSFFWLSCGLAGAPEGIEKEMAAYLDAVKRYELIR